MTTAKQTEKAVPAAVTPPVDNTFVETIKIALYGKFGSRKTLQIASLIDLVGVDNVLVVSAEHGLGTVRSTLTNKANIITVANMDQVRAAWGEAEKFGKAESGRWVAIDGMSEITEWIASTQLSMADRYYEAKQRGLEPAQSDLPAGKYLQRGEINSMAIYGRVGRDSSNLISAWIGLPVNLYTNYLEDMTGSSGFEKSVPWGPDVPGRVGLKAVMSSYDYVGRLYYDDKQRLCAGFDSTSNYYMARTREDRKVVQLQKVYEDFELGKFVQVVQGSKAAEKSA